MHIQPTQEKLWPAAMQAVEQNNPQLAITYLTQVLTEQPQHLAALEHLGILYAQTAQHQQALTCFQQLIAITPQAPLPYHNLGLAYLELQDPLAAIAAWETSLKLGNTLLQTLEKLTITCHGLRQQPQTVHYALQLLKHPDCSSHLRYTTAHILRECDALADALAAYQQTVAEQPAFAAAYEHCAITLQMLMRPHEALGYYDKALQLQPSPITHGNRSQALLMAGYLAEGFKEYEWRTRIPELSSIFSWFYRKPRWQGEVFSGKTLLIHDEQGMGDMLQFMRYFPLVKARGGIVAVSAKKPLLPLLEQVPGIDYVLEHTETVLTDFPFDLAVPLMSLPHIFGTTLATIPSHYPYVKLDEQRVAFWQKILSTSTSKPLKVGLVWAGNPKHTQALHRSAQLEDFLPLATCQQQVQYYSLQIGPAQQELLSLQDTFPILDFTPHIRDFADTAAFIQQLDLVISVDTAVAHLAGAMGKPVWTLLPFSAEWRWLVDRMDTPWYPTMRLFRQRQARAWQPLLQEVTTTLETYIQKKLP